ncbi:MAG TPA: lysozyme, partial [Marinobacter hydrocarbonoclasticus]|nr:lysozyme [Marinobacter nauticus]
MLDNDIDEVEKHLETVDEYNGLDPIRQTVLANMAFNLGFRGLMGFKKMWKAIARKDYTEAARQMLDSRWAHQVGYRAQELAQIMRTGVAGE